MPVRLVSSPVRRVSQIVSKTAIRRASYYAAIAQISALCVPDCAPEILSMPMTFALCAVKFVVPVPKSVLNMPLITIPAKLVRRHARSVQQLAHNMRRCLAGAKFLPMMFKHIC